MGRQPCCDKIGLKRGPWTIEEDQKLINFILNNGIQCWRLVPKLAGLMRCGKSCRLRWTNYLRPDLKRGALSEAEEDQIIQLHSRLGNRWSKIASHFPGRTDNEIKNHWNTRIKKRLKLLGLDPVTHEPIEQSEKCGSKGGHSSRSDASQVEEKSMEIMSMVDRNQEDNTVLEETQTGVGMGSDASNPLLQSPEIIQEMKAEGDHSSCSYASQVEEKSMVDRNREDNTVLDQETQNGVGMGSDASNPLLQSPEIIQEMKAEGNLTNSCSTSFSLDDTLCTSVGGPSSNLCWSDDMDSFASWDTLYHFEDVFSFGNFP